MRVILYRFSLSARWRDPKGSAEAAWKGERERTQGSSREECERQLEEAWGLRPPFRPPCGSLLRSFCRPRATQGPQYLTRKLVGSRPSKANPGSSGLFESAATEAAGAAAAAAAPADVAALDCILRCPFGDDGRAFWASCLPVRPMKRWMNVYMKEWEEGRSAQRKEESTEEGEEV